MRTNSLIALFAMTLALPALAAKPPGGGPSPTERLYFRYNLGDSSPVYSMLNDGSSKTVLGGSPGVPSRKLHGGKRWFLRTDWIQSDMRFELFAHREDGALSVRLTNSATMDTDAWVGPFDWVWAPNENATTATVTGPGRALDGTGTPVPGSAGLYTAVLRFDASGNVIGLDAPPAFLVAIGVADPLAAGHDEVPDLNYAPSYSPDMTKIVLDRFGDGLGLSGSELRIITVATGASTTLLTAPVGSYLEGPAWSPNGLKIAFDSGTVPGSKLEVISPNSTGRTLVYSARQNHIYAADWSPDSTQLAYNETDYNTGETDIYKIAVGGTGRTNLTSTVATVYLFGWR